MIALLSSASKSCKALFSWSVRLGNSLSQLAGASKSGFSFMRPDAVLIIDP